VTGRSQTQNKYQVVEGGHKPWVSKSVRHDTQSVIFGPQAVRSTKRNGIVTGSDLQ
jgi:hypothetical protein